MANRFWVGGNGTWDASDTTHWASTSGGGGGASVPGSSDNARFDANSGAAVVTLGAGYNPSIFLLQCLSTFSGTLDFSVNNNNISFVGMTFNGSGAFTLKMGSGTFTFDNTAGGGIDFSNTSFVLQPGTSTFKMIGSNNASFPQATLGSNRTYANLWIATDGGTTQDIRYTNTFADIKIDPNIIVRFEDGKTQTITSLTCAAGTQRTLKGTSTGGWTISKASGTVSIADCDIEYSTATGGATWNAFTTDGNVDNGNNSGWVFSSTTDYPMVAAVGAFTLTGIAAGLKLGWKILAAAGAFTLTSIATGLKIGIKMLADLGTFTLTGIDADFFYGKLIVAALGQFVLTGVDATITSTRKITADLGTFVLTGLDSILYVSHFLTAVLGEFVLFGSSASLNGFRAMSAALGQFTLTGIDVNFPRASKIFANTGVFVLTSIDAIISFGTILIAAVGEFTLTGVAALFPRASKIFANTGVFTLTGVAAAGLLNGISNIWAATTKHAANWVNKLKS